MAIADALKEKATLYFSQIEELDGAEPSAMLVDFVIEKYKQHRNFPNHYTDSMIELDMTNHMTTLAMAVVDLYMKIGAEGETSHSEKNIDRVYENAYISESLFSDVMPFVRVL